MKNQTANQPIPSTKFVNPNSCYSFIATCQEGEEGSIKIFFPPQVKVAEDFSDWLKDNNFIQEESYLYIAEYTKEVKESLFELLELAKPNGAYLAEDIENLEDKSQEKPSSVKTKFEALLERHLEKAIAKVSEQNQENNYRYEQRIEELENRIIEQEEFYKQEIEQLKKENVKLAEKLQEYESFFNLEEVSVSLDNQNNSNPSPFDSKINHVSTDKPDESKASQNGKTASVKTKTKSKSHFSKAEIATKKTPDKSSDYDPDLLESLEDKEEDISFLSSPFSGEEMEVLNPDEYDDKEFNELNSPVSNKATNKADKNGKTSKAKEEEGSVKNLEISLAELDLSSLEGDDPLEELNRGINDL